MKIAQKLIQLADTMDKRGLHAEANQVDSILRKLAGSYSLTLSKGERSAIDFVGNRYSNGDDLYEALWSKSKHTPEDADWDHNGDITFSVPEHVAWDIKEQAEQEDGGGQGNPVFPLFARELAEKMTRFVDQIV